MLYLSIVHWASRSYTELARHYCHNTHVHILYTQTWCIWRSWASESHTHNMYITSAPFNEWTTRSFLRCIENNIVWLCYSCRLEHNIIYICRVVFMRVSFLAVSAIWDRPSSLTKRTLCFCTGHIFMIKVLNDDHISPFFHSEINASSLIIRLKNSQRHFSYSPLIIRIELCTYHIFTVEQFKMNEDTAAIVESKLIIWYDTIHYIFWFIEMLTR